MTSYVFEYDGLQRPKVIKRVELSDNAAVDTVLNFYNEEEKLLLTTEQVYSHLDNLVQYIKDRSVLLSPVALTDPLPSDGWHFGGGGWAEVEWAKEEILKWWEFVYYKDEPEGEEQGPE